MRYEIEVIERHIGVIEVGGVESEDEAREALDEAYENGYVVWEEMEVSYGAVITKTEEN